MVNKYIKELLIETNRVIVPDFGAFIARVTSESREPDSLRHKTIVFNDILKFNDGLLVNHIIKTENIELTAALQKITEFTKIATDEFVKGNDYFIEGIGKLHRDKRGNITLFSDEDNLNVPEITPPPISQQQTEEIIIPAVVEANIVPPPLPEKNEIIIPPLIPQADKEEILVTPPVVPEITVIPTIQIREEAEKMSVENPVTEVKIEENQELSVIVNQIDVSVTVNQTSEPIKKEPVNQEETEKKSEKTIQDTKAKPVKPVKKDAKPLVVKKKSPVWIAIVVWSISGLLFLSLVFMASVKFGFIKGVKLFSQDEWISVNDKLHKDLEEYNKKHKDILTLPEVKKDDNNKGAFSSGEEGSGGSFDASATDVKTSEDTKTASSDEGSFGSFDTPAKTEETKEQKPVVTKTETKEISKDTKTSESSNSVGATGKYILVAGSFSNKNAAEIFVEQLKKKGFTNAEYAGIKNGTHMVCYGSYNDQKEANAEYRKLQQKAVQTWILKQ